MQVSYMRLRLESWYGQLERARTGGAMYAPQVTPAQARRFRTDAPRRPSGFGEAVRRYGVDRALPGERAREAKRRPLIIRRDFDTSTAGRPAFTSSRCSARSTTSSRPAKR